ncbi:MAG: DUF559 domain-containing protein [Candidatus Aureabacteria bacterium]|nr:DUF559 domain-containing protein [Candidatus Auribacterota bacterium]
MSTTNTPALVGIVPRKKLWPNILKERWYHIPFESAPRNVGKIKYLGFYFPTVFEEEFKCKVTYFSPVSDIDVLKRIELFRDEPQHPRAQKDYYRIRLGEIETLPHPIPSRRWRRIVHIPTTYEKLMGAREINDLWETSPLEDKIYDALKRKKIRPERQMFVCTRGKTYCLDFCIYCNNGNIDVECDGERYHTLPDALARDRQRNNEPTAHGWSVLRFSGKQIRERIPECLYLIEKTIKNKHGLA